MTGCFAMSWTHAHRQYKKLDSRLRTWQICQVLCHAACLKANHCAVESMICGQAHKESGAFESSFLDLQKLSQLPHGLDDMLARLQAAAALCLSTSGAQAHVRPACQTPDTPWNTQSDLG